MERSKSTDKLLILKELAELFKGNVVSIDELSLEWNLLEDSDNREVAVCPFVKIKGLKLRS